MSSNDKKKAPKAPAPSSAAQAAAQAPAAAKHDAAAAAEKVKSDALKAAHVVGEKAQEAKESASNTIKNATSGSAGAGAPSGHSSGASVPSGAGFTSTSGSVTKPDLKASTHAPAAEVDAATARDEATKARILAHMNQDHKLSLKDYLYHYGGVTATAQIASVTLVDITSSALVLNYSLESDHLNLRTLSIPIKPELASLADAREVLVNMAKTAAGARGYSPFQIKEFKWVSGPDILVPAAVLWTVVGLADPNLVYKNPKSPFVILVNLLLKAIGPLLPFDRDLIPQIAIMAMGEIKRRRKDIVKWTVIIHILESFFFMRPILNKYRVANPTKLYWYIACMIEGFPSLKRISKLGKSLDNQ
ncbi:hypothetical protein B0I72DRAFT_142184 [Yarrowia lipolytica]|jgi:hypothetical protein|uniref:YALI0D16423p n=2 Tax=Yarrowia lipolytica TaxID=4952 RepID=Q6C8W2_YARLI|nr:YALI0D16423p [Yarrowia lipolytica CLIB122]AOW04145.1 hypothetical protein YALI1_D20329g [Yarrowia lipolytica]KAB8281961.1 hypothetical protein BKA91DRAFT_139378 [Yarrowia lipolytica]KAE8170666.1 hypothetical protein BKA90DRAFT_140398 [Yarrowia lipolytica]KAJ8054318.1 hypothetical protein LXG23DRAFT_19999 [Yarrowia lipolytica]QNP98358.1 Hypothetical protein YALI2_D00799g [Yarrowia lipolytica]|eukprot:XP_502900.1 YALI0D16423p [Yarrowia lipolytica CLIB122]